MARALSAPAHRMVWRWHFYAGLFCIPFVVWLALTGTAYLFRPQVEAWLDRPYAAVAGPGPRASPAELAAAAVRAVPGSVLHRYQLPDTPEQAVQVLVGRDGQETRVYVHPQSRAVLHMVEEEWRPMRVVFRLHGELLAGPRGSYLVELAASWTIVLILTGLFLWWPRGRRGLAGVVYPRLRAGGRAFWRDLHAVVGLWVSAAALFLLVSGLPWSTSWGAYLKAIRTVVEGQPPPRQDWAGGDRHAAAGTRAMLDAHAEHGGMTMAHPAGDAAALDRVVAAVAPLRLAPPVLVAPPAGAHAPWTAKSDAANRPLRTDLTIDGTDGRILTRKDFAQRPLVDQLVGYGVAIHEGQMFGIANLLLNLATALGLVTLAVSGAMAWWRRRPQGVLGAPAAAIGVRGRAAFVGLLVALGFVLPLLGVSMLAVAAVERLVLARLPRARRWLGLPAQAGWRTARRSTSA